MNDEIREQVLGMVKSAGGIKRFGQLLRGGHPEVRRWMKTQLDPAADLAVKGITTAISGGEMPWLSRYFMRSGLRKALLRSSLRESPEVAAELRKVLAARLGTGAVAAGGAGYGMYRMFGEKRAAELTGVSGEGSAQTVKTAAGVRGDKALASINRLLRSRLTRGVAGAPEAAGSFIRAPLTDAGVVAGLKAIKADRLAALAAARPRSMTVPYRDHVLRDAARRLRGHHELTLPGGPGGPEPDRDRLALLRALVGRGI